MARTVSATEAARSFSDLLNRACFRGESFVIVRGREEVARLVPPQAPAPATTLGQLRGKLAGLSARRLVDGDFAADLARARESHSVPPSDPWEP